jgi:hypothetical protein
MELTTLPETVSVETNSLLLQENRNPLLVLDLRMSLKLGATPASKWDIKVLIVLTKILK